MVRKSFFFAGGEKQIEVRTFFALGRGSGGVYCTSILPSGFRAYIRALIAFVLPPAAPTRGKASKTYDGTFLCRFEVREASTRTL